MMAGRDTKGGLKRVTGDSAAAKPIPVPQTIPVPLLTTKEVAVALRVKESTIRHWVCTGALPNVKFPGAVRFRVDAIQTWIDAASRTGHGKPVSEVARDAAGEILSSPRANGSARRTGRRPAGRPAAVPSTIKREGSVA